MLYKPRAQIRLRVPDSVSRRRPVGENPPPGAIIDYWLASEPKDEVTLEILDADGKSVRKLSNREKKKTEQPPEWPDQEAPVTTIPANAGMNRFAWNLRWEGPVETPAYYPDSGPVGPIALPGKYQVRLTAFGKTTSHPLEIVPDPRVKTPYAEMKRNFDLAMKLRDRISELHVAMNQMKELRVQLGIVKHRFENEKVGGKKIVEAVDALEKKMNPIEERMYQTKVKSSEGTLNFPTMLNEQLNSLRYALEGSSTAPTAQTEEAFRHLSKDLDAALTLWKEASSSVAALNDLIKKSDAPLIVIHSGEAAPEVTTAQQ
jgi:hypothetical protein